MEHKPYLEEHERIQLRSDEVQDILTTPPSYFVRLGTVIIFIILAALVGIAYIIKYPDVINADLELTTANPPVKVVAQTAGAIEQLLVSRDDIVELGDPLAIIESAARYEDVLIAEAFVDTLLANPESNMILPENLSLGVAQIEYSRFLANSKESTFELNTTLNDDQIFQLQLKRSSLESSVEEIDISMKAVQNNLTILKSEIETQKKLLAQGDISTIEYRAFIKKEPDLIDRINQYIIQKKGVKAQLAEINAQILSIQRTKNAQQNTTKVASESSLLELKGAIERYKEKYVLRAPVDGKVSFREERLEKQVLTSEEEVLSILTEESGEYIGVVSLPSEGSGKVKEKDRVIIKFNGYPFREFGSVEGLVMQKSLLPKEGTYRVKVKLPNGPVTSFGRTITFSPEMAGRAEIITENRSIIERILENFFAVFREYKEAS